MRLFLNRKHLAWNLLSLFFLLGVVLFYSFLVSSNETIVDARNYFYYYNDILDNGFISSAWKNYDGSGKFEPVILVFYKLYAILFGSLVHTDKFYWFVFYNYVVIGLLTVCIISLFSKMFVPSKKHMAIFFSILLSFFWFPSYLNMLWLWRADIAYTFALLSLFLFLSGRLYYSAFFSIAATLTHYSSFPIIAVILFFHIFVFHFKNGSSGVKALVVVVFSICISFLYVFIKQYVSSGSAKWGGDYYLRYIILLYFFFGVVVYYLMLSSLRSSFSNYLYSFLFSILMFFLFSLIVSILGARNYQDSFRIMHFSYLSFCIFFPILMMLSNICMKIISSTYLLIGVMAAFYLFSGFYISLG